MEVFHPGGLTVWTRLILEFEISDSEIQSLKIDVVTANSIGLNNWKKNVQITKKTRDKHLLPSRRLLAHTYHLLDLGREALVEPKL